MTALPSSPHSSPSSSGGRTYDLHIHRLDGEADWVPEIADDDGTSFCFEDRFADDADALAEARRAIEAGACAPLGPEAGEVQGAFVRVAGCSGLAHSPAYALGYFTAAISSPPQDHQMRVLTEMLGLEAETADLEHTPKPSPSCTARSPSRLDLEAVDLSYLSADGLADWARGCGSTAGALLRR